MTVDTRRTALGIGATERRSLVARGGRAARHILQRGAEGRQTP